MTEILGGNKVNAQKVRGFRVFLLQDANCQTRFFHQNSQIQHANSNYVNLSLLGPSVLTNTDQRIDDGLKV